MLPEKENIWNCLGERVRVSKRAHIRGNLFKGTGTIHICFTLGDNTFEKS